MLGKGINVLDFTTIGCAWIGFGPTNGLLRKPSSSIPPGSRLRCEGGGCEILIALWGLVKTPYLLRRGQAGVVGLQSRMYHHHGVENVWL